jgi:hypothetical protein
MRRLLLLSTIVAAVSPAILLGACGGDDEDNGATMSDPASASPFGGGTPPSDPRGFPPAFVKCMADRGVDVTSVESIHSAQAAFQACLPSLHGG